MDLADALLDSWDRQCRIVESIASKVDAANRKVLPSPDGWPLDRQLAHIHEVRYEWLGKVSPDRANALGESFEPDGETALANLDAIRAELTKSGKAVRDAVEERLADPKPIGGYDHPVLFLQHMVWHEGWHVGLILLGLRLAGQEPSPEWEAANVWGRWRTEVWP